MTDVAIHSRTGTAVWSLPHLDDASDRELDELCWLIGEDVRQHPGEATAYVRWSRESLAPATQTTATPAASTTAGVAATKPSRPAAVPSPAGMTPGAGREVSTTSGGSAGVPVGARIEGARAGLVSGVTA